MDTSPMLKKGEGEGSRKKAVSKSTRAGLQFPVGRICRFLKKGRYADRVSTNASVYLAAVLQFLAAELLKLAAEVAHDFNKKRITPRNIWLAASIDHKEFGKLLAGVTIVNGGFVRHSNIPHFNIIKLKI